MRVDVGMGSRVMRVFVLNSCDGHVTGRHRMGKMIRTLLYDVAGMWGVVKCSISIYASRQGWQYM